MPRYQDHHVSILMRMASVFRSNAKTNIISVISTLNTTRIFFTKRKTEHLLGVEQQTPCFLSYRVPTPQHHQCLTASGCGQFELDFRGPETLSISRAGQSEKLPFATSVADMRHIFTVSVQSHGKHLVPKCHCYLASLLYRVTERNLPLHPPPPPASPIVIKHCFFHQRGSPDVSKVLSSSKA